MPAVLDDNIVKALIDLKLALASKKSVAELLELERAKLEKMEEGKQKEIFAKYVCSVEFRLAKAETKLLSIIDKRSKTETIDLKKGNSSSESAENLMTQLLDKVQISAESAKQLKVFSENAGAAHIRYFIEVIKHNDPILGAFVQFAGKEQIKHFLGAANEQQLGVFFKNATNEQIRTFLPVRTDRQLEVFSQYAGKTQVEFFLDDATEKEIGIFFNHAGEKEINYFLRSNLVNDGDNTIILLNMFLKLAGAEQMKAFFKHASSDQMTFFLRQATADQFDFFLQHADKDKIIFLANHKVTFSQDINPELIDKIQNVARYIEKRDKNPKDRYGIFGFGYSKENKITAAMAAIRAYGSGEVDLSPNMEHCLFQRATYIDFFKSDLAKAIGFSNVRDLKAKISEIHTTKPSRSF